MPYAQYPIHYTICIGEEQNQITHEQIFKVCVFFANGYTVWAFGRLLYQNTVKVPKVHQALRVEVEEEEEVLEGDCKKSRIVKV